MQTKQTNKQQNATIKNIQIAKQLFVFCFLFFGSLQRFLVCCCKTQYITISFCMFKAPPWKPLPKIVNEHNKTTLSLKINATNQRTKTLCFVLSFLQQTCNKLCKVQTKTQMNNFWQQQEESGFANGIYIYALCLWVCIFVSLNMSTLFAELVGAFSLPS